MCIVAPLFVICCNNKKISQHQKSLKHYLYAGSYFIHTIQLVNMLFHIILFILKKEMMGISNEFLCPHKLRALCPNSSSRSSNVPRDDASRLPCCCWQFPCFAGMPARGGGDHARERRRCPSGGAPGCSPWISCCSRVVPFRSCE